jgi:hypothetical protein
MAHLRVNMGGRHRLSTAHFRVSGVRHKDNITMAIRLALLIMDLDRSMAILVMAHPKVNLHKALLVISTLHSKGITKHSIIKAKLINYPVKILVMKVHVGRTVTVLGRTVSLAVNLPSKANSK